jgi:hypothetical protein
VYDEEFTKKMLSITLIDVDTTFELTLDREQYLMVKWIDMKIGDIKMTPFEEGLDVD